MSEYVVEVKPSARRANGAVGSIVHRRGARRRFEAREDAESWASGLSTDDDGRKVWIRAANPNDPADVDAYLVSRRPRRGAVVTGGGGSDVERRQVDVDARPSQASSERS